MLTHTDASNHVTVTTDDGEAVFDTRAIVDCDDIAGLGFADCYGRWLVLVADVRGDEDWQLIVADVTHGLEHLRIPACGARGLTTGDDTVIVPTWLSGLYSVLAVSFDAAGEPCFDLLLQTSRHGHTATIDMRGGSLVIEGGGSGACATILHPPPRPGDPWREEVLDQARHGRFAGARAGVTYSYLPRGEVVAARATGRTSISVPARLESVVISGDLGVGLRAGSGDSGDSGDAQTLVPFVVADGAALPEAAARDCTFLREGRRPGEVMVHSLTRGLSMRQSAWELAEDRRGVVTDVVSDAPPLVRCSWTTHAADAWALDVYSGDSSPRGVLVDCYGAYGNASPPLFPKTWEWCLECAIDVVVVNPRVDDRAGRSLRSAVALADAVEWITSHISSKVVCAGSSAGATVLLAALVLSRAEVRGVALMNPLIPQPDGRLVGERDQWEFASAEGLDWSSIARGMWAGEVSCRGAISLGQNDARIDVALAREFCAAQTRAAGTPDAWPCHVSSPGGHRGSSPRIEAEAVDFWRRRISGFLDTEVISECGAGHP